VPDDPVVHLDGPDEDGRRPELGDPPRDDAITRDPHPNRDTP
jgi:hypothetical protein